MKTYTCLLFITLTTSLLRVKCSNDRGWAWSCDELQNIHTEVQDNYVSYSFRLTPTPGNFEKSRLLCNEMGGDLITNNLDHQGLSRHEEIRDLVENNIGDKYLWIGMNDRGQEGNYRLINGTAYDVTDLNLPALYRWYSTQPDNNLKVSDISGIDEDCIHIQGKPGSEIGLNDFPCHMDHLNDNLVEFYGLCEILTYKCVPSKF